MPAKEHYTKKTIGKYYLSYAFELRDPDENFRLTRGN